ncbi:MAG TPA: UDP-N-acetylmuramoyl-L-alanyl-D-glutamate--2,6-diaminopimelate ligase [Polyangia bacterium]|jgi:UDP-N-acetylmuramoyl-L-alanyl-D-glutamate--2,6-diaminopimelate ligase|nr:UDP-N-acetylmuramoyl-L-alanyl-D-glutamate--2,6-diaminopimelate ligase [Polyangia bacterium]
MTGPFQLRALLDGVAELDVAALPPGALDVEVAEVRDDSRQVQAGDLFVAVPGTKVDGRRFVAEVAARGARVLVTEGAPPPFPGLVVGVASARRALGVIAANRFGAARALDLLAVTGTNGKTTTTFLLETMLLAAGRRAGVIGTVSNRAPGWPGGARAASLTTPGALEINALFAEMRAAAATDVVLEATSQALEQGRLEGCRFLVAGLTNVTLDHLDYHGTMERYFDAKAILFERLMRHDGVGVFFVEQDEGRRMRARTRGRTLGVALTPAAATRAGGAAEVVVTRAVQTAEGWRLQLATPIGTIDLTSPLVGDFNLSNLALAVGMAVARGLDRDAIVTGLARLAGVPGRLERVANPRGVLCLVDYSHTPDALERAIAAVRPLTAGRVVVVFGCGGDRDRSKRPVMGEIVARDADLAIVTSDNPRTEEPGSILDMIVDGVRRQGLPELEAAALAGAVRGYHREVDRRAAIRRAAAACRAGEVLLIAGKGHEDYQILGTTKVHFDDREEASAALAAVTASGANP